MSSVFQRDWNNHSCRCRSQCGCSRSCNSCCQSRSCGSDPMNVDLNNMFAIIDPSQVELIANQFLEEYYQKVSNIGWNSVLHLYVPDAVITCNTNIYSGGHEFLNALSNEYIKRANYDGLGSTWSLVDESKMVITVFGEIQFVGFTGDCSGVGHFSDTFVLKAYPNETYGIIHHSFYFS